MEKDKDPKNKYTVDFGDTRKHDDQIIIRTNRHIKDAPFVTEQSYIGGTIPEWARKILKQSNVTDLSVESHTIRIFTTDKFGKHRDKLFFSEEVWKDIKPYMEKEVLSKLE